MNKRIIAIFTMLVVTTSTIFAADKTPAKLYPSIISYVKNAERDFDKIPEDRKLQLKKIALYLKTKLSSEKKANMVFICTHNSRRSHTAQLWANIAAEYYGIQGVSNFSGGLEVTAFNERMVKALTKAGLIITKKTDGTNPNYEVKIADNAPVVTAFSKKYMDAPNPTVNFAAVMTCSHADKNCPIVQGASIKISTPYEDPKDADGKPNETEVYNERCKQIATEVLYAFSLVKSGK
jgi:protein-tyrosine phosphatase/arsenate reductase